MNNIKLNKKLSCFFITFIKNQFITTVYVVKNYKRSLNDEN